MLLYVLARAACLEGRPARYIVVWTWRIETSVRRAAEEKLAGMEELMIWPSGRPSVVRRVWQPKAAKSNGARRSFQYGPRPGSHAVQRYIAQLVYSRIPTTRSNHTSWRSPVHVSLREHHHRRPPSNPYQPTVTIWYCEAQRHPVFCSLPLKQVQRRPALVPTSRRQTDLLACRCRSLPLCCSSHADSGSLLALIRGSSSVDLGSHGGLMTIWLITCFARRCSQLNVRKSVQSRRRVLSSAAHGGGGGDRTEYRELRMAS